MAEYFDYLTSNGERYYPYTRVDGIFDTNGQPFTEWIYSINIHNHDIRYAAASHIHDTRYSLLTHKHDEDYAPMLHTHNYAGANTPSGAANTALALDQAFTLNVIGGMTGSVSIVGDTDVELDLAINHNHDDVYLRYDSNISIIANNDESPALSMTTINSTPKINMAKQDIPQSALIEYTGTTLNFDIGSKSMTLSPEGLFIDSDRIPTQVDLDGKQPLGDYAPLSHTHDEYYARNQQSYVLGSADFALSYLTLRSTRTDFKVTNYESGVNILVIRDGSSNICRIDMRRNGQGHSGLNIIDIYAFGHDDTPLITINGGQLEDTTYGDGPLSGEVEPSVTINANVTVNKLIDLSATS